MHNKEISGRTYHYDLLRGGFDGVIDTGASTFALFIAIRYYHAGSQAKSLIAAAPWLGMVLSLLMVHYASRTPAKKSLCAAVPAALAGICLLAAAWMDSLLLFTFFIIAAYVCQTSLVPFLTSIYTDNYPPSKRGAFYSNPLRLTVGVSILFSFAASQLLDLDLQYFTIVFSVLGVCGLGKAWAVYSMPSTKIEAGEHKHPFGNFKYVIQDRSFGYVLLTWFIMGFANLWIQPLRLDYLTSEAYGITGSAALVALIITIIPNGMRLIFIPFWGKLFDRMNFVVLRMVFNIIFACGVGFYFVTKNPVFIALGSMLIGIAFAGGSIAWNLWVTKYAPPGKAAAYMSVHVCLTGIRGTFGPMIGFWAVEQVGPVTMGLISASLMTLATLMLIPEIKHGRQLTP
ncbi:MAG: MFS transporter [Nitrospinota bacterium]|nr:MFS transporter [Nitrospinota bacterium]